MSLGARLYSTVSQIESSRNQSARHIAARANPPITVAVNAAEKVTKISGRVMLP